MCGFLGEFLFQGYTSTSEEEFKGLLKLSKHRGPDSTEIVSVSNFQLGFNRLAILDVSVNANQPKQSPSKRYQLVFNGEIYNFKELAKEYKLTDLHSTSDTEVIIHLLDKIGIENTIKELNGMFSIAIIDTKSNDLYLIRDFAGIKPLFYGVSEKGIVFASQFNQIYKHSFFNSTLQFQPAIIKEYFGLGYMQAPNTIYQNIYQAKPGEFIRISKKGTIVKEFFHRYSSSIESSGNELENIKANEYNKILESVINRQLVSDVPLAAFLSGGIDSPLVCAIAKKQQPNIKTFTIGVDHTTYDESKKASEYAKHLKVSQHIESITTDQLLAHIEQHFKFFTEPFGDYSSIPTYLITKMAKKQHTVMLSGDGGDELFFGYPRMLDIVRKRFWFKVPHIIRKPIIRLFSKLKLVDSWAPYSYKKLEDWVLGKHLHISPKNLNQFFPDISFSKELRALYQLPKKKSKKALLHWLRYNEFYAHMQRVLVKVDRMSMANSLEVRVPLLDKKSIDFAWKLIPPFTKNKIELKGLLKKVMESYFPKEMMEKEKKGFSVPIDDWLKNQLKEDVKKVIFETPLYGKEHIDCEKVKQYVTNYFDGKHNESWGIWHVYTWQKWAVEEGFIA